MAYQHSKYLSAPNDVWSLGVVLVNLTCGRNPWKKASSDDATFRAFEQDPSFLRSILPISAELNFILGRIFDPNPRTRITLDQLRHLIVACPRLTASAYHQLPPSPPCMPYDYDVVDCTDAALPLSPQDSLSYHSTGEPWLLCEPRDKQSSDGSTLSAESSVDFDASHDPQPMNFYGNLIPLFDYQKPHYTAFPHPAIAVY